MRLRRIAIIFAGGVLCLGYLAESVGATPLHDPIVRVREGGASIPIPVMPFQFSFQFALQQSGVPFNPDPGNCITGADASTGLGFPGDPAEPFVSCAFQNQAGQPISALSFVYDLQDPPVQAQPLAFFAAGTATASAANFTGGTGVPPCVVDGASGSCLGGDFAIDWIGYRDGSTISMTATSATPEPATLLLLGSGLLVAGLRRRGN